MALPIRRLPPKPAATVQTTASPKPPLRLPGKPAAAAAAPKPGLPVRRPAPTPGVSKTVEDGFDKSRRLKEEQDAEIERRRAKLYEFGMKVGEKTKNRVTGKEEPGVELLILDKAALPKMPYFHWYHRWGYVEGVKGSGKEDICLKETDEGCPLCEDLGKEGRWEMCLTVLDKRPYTPQSGPNANKVVPMSRKLLVAKSKMIPHFEELFKDHKKFRGMVVRVFRDGPKDEKIGSRVKFIKFLTEAEIQKLPQELREPMDYVKAWPICDRAELAGRNKLTNGGTATAKLGAADFTDDDIPF